MSILKKNKTSHFTWEVLNATKFLSFSNLVSLKTSIINTPKSFLFQLFIYFMYFSKQTIHKTYCCRNMKRRKGSGGDHISEEMRCLKQVLTTLYPWGYLKVEFSSPTHLEPSERIGWILYTQATVGCQDEWEEGPSPNWESLVIPFWTMTGISGGQSMWWAEVGRTQKSA